MTFDIIKRLKLFQILLLVLLIFSVDRARAQCPLNIDFEQGTFANWQCYVGRVEDIGVNNVVTVTPSAATNGIHTIIPKGKLLDPYGNFPISAPDGSAYSIKLGNSGTGAQAERLSYTFTVPADQPNFSITYQYAVVLEDPGHATYQQPRFAAKVFDVEANTYITCSSFDYVATASLPGFKRSANSSVIYKPWVPVNINLTGYAGRKIRLEFTTADCTESGHFGYAYIDVNRTCANAITGNDYCSSATNVNIKGPEGFDKYTWYNEDRSVVLGTGSTLSYSTPPPNGTKIGLDVVPFAGFGCPNNFIAVINSHDITFTATDPPMACFPSTVDITKSAVILPTDKNGLFSYWKDAACTVSLDNPDQIAISGIYYIKMVSSYGCEDVKAVKVVINIPPDFNVINPGIECLGTLIDITTSNTITGSTAGSAFTFWADANVTLPLANPKAISLPGTYYIKATLPTGCSTIKPVVVSFFPPFTFKINNPAEVCFPSVIDLTALNITAGSTAGLQISYYTDALATIPLTTPAQVTTTGTYYIKAATINGCFEILPVKAIINPLPVLTITNPMAVCYPGMIDLGAAAVTAGSTNVDKLTYWMDAAAQTPLTVYRSVPASGTFYIKATSVAGCETIMPVKVIVNPLPDVIVTNPKRASLPNTVDITQAEVTNGSTPGLTFSYFEDEAATIKLNNPKALDKAGTYFIRGTNIYGCYSTRPVTIAITDEGKILVPKAFTPTQTENNRLFAFIVGVKTMVSFKIYNRWGMLLFQTDSTEPAKGWDGYYKGQLQQMDTYTWYAEGFDYVGRPVHNSGNTLLIK